MNSLCPDVAPPVTRENNVDLTPIELLEIQAGEGGDELGEIEGNSPYKWLSG